MADSYDRLANLGKYAGNNGVPGGHRGAGRPKSEVRDAFQLAGADRLKVLVEIADDKTKRPKDRTDAVKAMLQYGMGQHVEVALSNADALERIARVTAKYLPEKDFADWLSDCRKAFNDV